MSRHAMWRRVSRPSVGGPTALDAIAMKNSGPCSTARTGPSEGGRAAGRICESEACFFRRRSCFGDDVVVRVSRSGDDLQICCSYQRLYHPIERMQKPLTPGRLDPHGTCAGCRLLLDARIELARSEAINEYF
jgi:hypothetical protein